MSNPQRIIFTADNRGPASLAFTRADGHELSMAKDNSLIEWNRGELVTDHGATFNGERFAHELLAFLTPDSLVSPQFLRLVHSGTYSDNVIALHIKAVADHAARLHPEWEDAPLIQTRDTRAAELGSTRYRVGIAWMWVSGFPNERAAEQYAQHVRDTEKRERVHTERDSDGTFTVAIHF